MTVVYIYVCKTVKENYSSMAINGTLSDETVASGRFNVMQILQSVIASVGIVANLTVIIVFLTHKKLRHKIPNIYS